jgi:hypothetical protein
MLIPQSGQEKPEAGNGLEHFQRGMEAGFKVGNR